VEDTESADESVVDDDVFAGWVVAHSRLLYVLASREVGAADADDLVQETLTRAWQRRNTFDPTRGTVKTWLIMLLL